MKRAAFLVPLLLAACDPPVAGEADGKKADELTIDQQHARESLCHDAGLTAGHNTKTREVFCLLPTDQLYRILIDYHKHYEKVDRFRMREVTPTTPEKQ